MSLFKRGSVYWYEFSFQGVRIRESARTKNGQVAERIMREHRRKLELGRGGMKEVVKPKTFAAAAKDWLTVSTAQWSASNLRIETFNVGHLLPRFGKMLLTDITADDVKRYQAARLAEEASPKTINLEVAALRAVLRKHRLWANIQPDISMLRTREDIGRALTADEQHRLLTACKASRSRTLYPAFLLSLHTGLRNAELRNLRWRNVDLAAGEITVGKSKTQAGEGRKVPLSKMAHEAIREWRANFPEALPSHYVFCSERYGLDGEKGHKDGRVVPYLVDPTKPISSFKVAWTAAREAAKVDCRWHDARHSFVSALAEGEASDTTIMALAGHVSRKMMARYSHTGNKAKRAAISVFDRPVTGEIHTKQNTSPQNPPQSENSRKGCNHLTY
jgi:integrase